MGAEAERCQHQPVNAVSFCLSHCQVALADPVKKQTGGKDK
jgi:hypothetical protein